METIKTSQDAPIEIAVLGDRLAPMLVPPSSPWPVAWFAGTGFALGVLVLAWWFRFLKRAYRREALKRLKKLGSLSSPQEEVRLLLASLLWTAYGVRSANFRETMSYLARGCPHLLLDTALITSFQQFLYHQEPLPAGVWEEWESYLRTWIKGHLTTLAPPPLEDPVSSLDAMVPEVDYRTRGEL